jgi:hypothetical protein
MDAVIGLLGLAVFAACVIVFAAACTWLVVKLSPARSGSQPKS